MMTPYEQLCHDMVGAMCSALQYMKNAVEFNIPITADVVRQTHSDFKKLIERWHEMRE